ncbi:ATP-binding domain-containing protein [Planctomonas sp. JC2975]|uniref:ATP-binding domain-containing protein n=1 Tax=Planctomonas sp. JC2975 TaxID=2729626 RepID=UPI001F100189|nr:ATP-binding domain-containing protein [Planctomonas sp. JC2975]
MATALYEFTNPDGLDGVHRERPQHTEIDETDAAVISAPDARGLEFDTVIIIDPNGIHAAIDAGLRDLYVGQTRATKRLFTLEVATTV